MRYVIGKGSTGVSTHVHDVRTGQHRAQRGVARQPEPCPASLTQHDHSRPGHTARNDDQMLAGPDVSSRR